MTDDKDDSDKGSESDEDDEGGDDKIFAKYEQELGEEILNRQPLHFTYGEFITTQWLKALCCCCPCLKNQAWLKRRNMRVKIYEEASERLSGEIDILSFIQTSRILKFLASYSLRRN